MTKQPLFSLEILHTSRHKLNCVVHIYRTEIYPGLKESKEAYDSGIIQSDNLTKLGELKKLLEEEGETCYLR